MRKVILPILAIFIFICCENSNESGIKNAIVLEEKSDKFLKSELRIISNLDQGIKKAMDEKKPILLYFTGYAVVNGQRIEWNLLLKNEIIFQTMKNDYINVWLYVDDENDGSKWSEYQREKFKSNVQPFFVILDSNGKPISKGMGFSEVWTNLENELAKHK